jgi:hypothetical protein
MGHVPTMPGSIWVVINDLSCFLITPVTHLTAPLFAPGESGEKFMQR